MTLFQLFQIIDAVCIAIAFFFPNEIFGYSLAAVNAVVWGVWALVEYGKREDKRRHLDEIDLVF